MARIGRKALDLAIGKFLLSETGHWRLRDYSPSKPPLPLNSSAEVEESPKPVAPREQHIRVISIPVCVLDVDGVRTFQARGHEAAIPNTYFLISAMLAKEFEIPARHGFIAWIARAALSDETICTTFSYSKK